MFRDYYKILNISPSASKADIKSAYRKQAQIWHPDKNLGKDTNAEMRQIVEAYSLLYDDEARIRYDIEYSKYQNFNRKKAEKTKTKEEPTATSKPEQESNSYQETYSTEDEVLRDWMDKAREQAKTYVAEIAKEAKEVAKDATKGAWQGVKSTLVVIVIINLVVLVFRGCF